MTFRFQSSVFPLQINNSIVHRGTTTTTRLVFLTWSEVVNHLEGKQATQFSFTVDLCLIALASSASDADSDVHRVLHWPAITLRIRPVNLSVSGFSLRRRSGPHCQAKFSADQMINDCLSYAHTHGYGSPFHWFTFNRYKSLLFICLSLSLLFQGEVKAHCSADPRTKQPTFTFTLRILKITTLTTP